MNRFWTIAIIMLLAVSSANAQSVSWTYPAGDARAPEAVFGTAGSSSHTLIGGASSTVPLRIPDGSQFAAIQIRSGTGTMYAGETYSVTGTISDATAMVGVFADFGTADYYADNVKTIVNPPGAYEVQSSGNAAAVAWYTVPKLDKYGLYNVPVGAARWLVIAYQIESDGLTAQNAAGVYFKVTFKE